ncbi:hypothetical protein NP233_g12796 [Leucocoprinus birnbaumii]|uniref:Uncharacterized protein n=1 Tax=Leucocoprinus birnbaumii TaxID=56174 RepID=A0AAD5VE74_9AGAR|nr:hypothetical protein NP233_g12796 [Leucocoprinus birnbaumii]
MSWSSPSQYTKGAGSRRRKLFIFAFVLVAIIFLLSLRPVQQFSPVSSLLPVNDVDKNTDYPPSYERLRNWEDSLPQHNLDLPLPEGSHGRFVIFPERRKKLGWNNCLNEILMDSYLAYKSKRAFVFRDYVWQSNTTRGPTAGGPWGEGDKAPRSVSEEYFNRVCPKSKRRIINTRDIRPDAEANLDSGKVVFDRWVDLLLNAPERCIEIQSPSVQHDDHWQVFGMFMWASDRILDLWEEFRDSPVSQLLETSPVVNAAVARNEYLFIPRKRGSTAKSHRPYDRMMAIHIRRGDYKEQCLDLARWNSMFYGWTLLPSLPDKFVLPPEGTSPSDHAAAYLERCLPDFDAIVRKIRTSRQDYLNSNQNAQQPTLDTLYILTNEHSEWLMKLKEHLRGEGWDLIVTSQDLVLDAEGVDVSMAVDMDIARRAAVFIGNGLDWTIDFSDAVFLVPVCVWRKNLAALRLPRLRALSSIEIPRPGH